MLLAACSSDSESESTATPTASATVQPSAEPTAVDEGHSLVQLVDVETGEQTAIFDGSGTASAWFERGGQVANVLVLSPIAPARWLRVDLSGAVLDDTTEQIQLRVSPDGLARAYGASEAAGAAVETRLEYDGELVPLEGDATTLPLGFSPSSDRLFSLSAVPGANENEVMFRYAVHDVVTGALVNEFENRLPQVSDGTNLPHWSPSGDYISVLGFGGLTVHDVATRGEFQIPTLGWTEWSPTEDALVMVAGIDAMQVLRFPSLEGTRLEIATADASASFDPTGQVVAVSNFRSGQTVIFDATSGEEIATWAGVAEAIRREGFEPVVMTDEGLAAVLEQAPGCTGFLVIHPSVTAAGECVDGRNPRWSPDASALAYLAGDEVIIRSVVTGEQRVVASGVPTEGTGTLARWNEGGTHLLIAWPWGAGGWSDTLP